MTSKDKRLLLSQASRLTTLGKRLDDERQKLKTLVGQGVAYDLPKSLPHWKTAKGSVRSGISLNPNI